MKKVILTLICLFLAGKTLAAAETVRIYNNNPRYKMLINYQFCALLRKGSEPTDCAPRVKTITISKGHHYVDINIVNWAFYTKVMNAYLLDDNNIAKAYGSFSEEDCKVFNNSPVTLIEEEHSRHTEHRIVCVKRQ